MNRTHNTLFLITSVDGKISTGSVNERDFDKDLPKIKGIKEGLHQYYEIEKTTDFYSLNTGKVMAKIGMNKKGLKIKKIDVNFVIIDSKHLNQSGVTNLAKRTNKLFIVTTNKKHPAFGSKEKNVEIFYYPNKINFANFFQKLKKEYGAKRVTIQSGGTLNAVLLREGLIDEISIVVAPALIGGKDTATLIDGESLISEKSLKKIRALKLKKCEKLKNDYLHLTYIVKN